MQVNLAWEVIFMNLSLIGTIYLWTLTRTWSGSVRDLILNVEGEPLAPELSLGLFF
jgi:hypothetical protein